MSIVAAVKRAVNAGHDFWMVNLPETCVESQKVSMKRAYYRGCRELDRENKDESRDALIMKSAARALKNQGIRGLCFY